jgi:hypothetical protein
MAHPNEDFIKRFNQTTPPGMEQRRLPGKSDIINLHKKLRSEDTKTLRQKDKNDTLFLLEKFYKNKVKEPQKKEDPKNWKIVMTPRGLFYYNVETKMWMNAYGQTSMNFEELVNVMEDFGQDTIYFDTQLPPLPEPTSALDYEVFATTFQGPLPVGWNTPGYQYKAIVPLVALTANTNNGFRTMTNSMYWTTFLEQIQTVPEGRRAVSTYVYWDELVSWTQLKHNYYKATTDGFTFAGARFLNPWTDNQYNDCKNHLINEVLTYLDSQNINIDYFCDDKETVAPLWGGAGYNSGPWFNADTEQAFLSNFDAQGNPIAVFPSSGGWTLDARIIGSVVVDPRVESFIDPGTSKSIAQNVVDTYKTISGNSAYGGTLGALFDRFTGITHPGDFHAFGYNNVKPYSFFNRPGAALTSAERTDELYKNAAWYGVLHQFTNSYYATRMFTEGFAAVPRFAGCTYSNYENFPISAEEAYFARDSNDQPFCQLPFTSGSGGKGFYNWSGNIINPIGGGNTYLVSGYVTNPTTDRERYTWCGHNDYPYSGPGNLVRYANTKTTNFALWQSQVPHKQFIDDLKWVRHMHRSDSNFWKYHTPWLNLGGIGLQTSYEQDGYKYWYDLVYHILLHGVLYCVHFDTIYAYYENKMQIALDNWRNQSYNSKARPCSNSTGNINLPVDRLLIGDSILNVAKSGGYILKTGKYLWRITAPPTAIRGDGTIVFARVGSDSDIPATVTVDTTVEGNGCGIWIERSTSTPPSYQVVEEFTP